MTAILAAPTGTHAGCGGHVTAGTCQQCGADFIAPANIKATS